MNIGFFEVEKWEEEYLRKKLNKDNLIFFKDQLNQYNIDKVKSCDALVVFIYSNIDENNISKIKKLKFISTMSTGFDHINLDDCKKKGIRVSNVPSYGENTVAEHAFALILTLSRKINLAVNNTRNNNFSLRGLMGFDLKGKTLGVIGTGHIGKHVIRIAKGFDMNVIAHSNNIDKKLSKKIGFEYCSLDKLLSSSDIITIHTPLNDKTRHMINMKNVKKIKKGAYLINNARGEIVDTQALIYALDKNILAGAGLDVLEGECEIKEEKELLHGKDCDMQLLLENHVLLRERNVIVTPHCAFYSKEAIERILDTTVDNINSFKKGKTINRVL